MDILSDEDYEDMLWHIHALQSDYLDGYISAEDMARGFERLSELYN